jgi:hypothetical protein
MTTTPVVTGGIVLPAAALTVPKRSAAQVKSRHELKKPVSPSVQSVQSDDLLKGSLSV